MLFAAAGPVAGSELFPERIKAFDRQFEKLGEYRYVYGLVFDLYEVALFAAPGADAEDVLEADASFHLQFHYLRKIDKAIILKSADRMLEKNLSDEQRVSISERVDQINRAYRSVKKGDRSSLTYRPDTGTTLRINGEPVITIEGRDFARLYFQIWLGEQPISTSMKQSLLGQR
ncbi:MAG TPA: chalcone isomerase family protein [Opitutales bacterium]|nr:chalcone isomerase family protein [Opitutales bacterium]